VDCEDDESLEEDEANDYFDCFTTFAKASSLSEGLLTPEFPFNATAFN
jgi:hypothetical protein